MQLDIAHARRYRAIGIEHLRRRLIVFVTPDDADRRGHALKLADVILQAGAVAGNTGGVA